MDEHQVGMHIDIYKDAHGNQYVMYVLDGQTEQKKFFPDGFVQRGALKGIVEKLK